MKEGSMKLRFLLIAVLGLALVCPAYAQDKPVWKGKIEYEDGVKVIKNPKEPLFGEIIFELEEDLVIGNEEDENKAFYRGIRYNIDREGNIFISDVGNYRVQKFDKNGKYIMTLGRKGQGPGEFLDVGIITFDQNENIYVQNSFTSSISRPESSEKYNLGFSPTYILVFNNKGSLLYTLGKRGSPDIPFNFIERLGAAAG